ncbi:hypothetical protein [Enterococcus larvae]|uniref:hypothetical protein n=1 Tax=Enterococcus larvae TaxID=2794352 RepID=UPI001FD7F549|nr:hypothetical protein [Enterococcus larvae]
MEEEGVEILLQVEYGDLTFTREKGIDNDYFELMFEFNGENEMISGATLQLKGNIDGKSKDILYYDVSSGRIVETTLLNSDIDELSEVLDSLGYSDKELVSFVQWYYETNKK